MPRRALQSTSLLLAFALLEPLAWKAHLLVRQPEWKVRWGYSVPQGWTVRRELSGQREPPVPRKLALVVLAVRLERSEPRERQEYLAPRMQALPVVSEQLVLRAHSVRRARLCPY